MDVETTTTPESGCAASSPSATPVVIVESIDADNIPQVLLDLRLFLGTSGTSETGEDNINSSDNIDQSKEFPSDNGNSEFHHNNNSNLFDSSATAVPVAAIKALLGVVQRSNAETMMGLQDELQQAAKHMTEHYPGNIALQSGIELFLKYITRTFLETPDFSQCRQAVLERGTRFQTMSLAARDRIAQQAASFVRGTVLTHGWSRVVAALIRHAAQQHSTLHNHTTALRLIVLEGRPDASGAKAAQFYAKETNIPVTVVADAAMGYMMEQVDMVLVGAEGVLENGGIVNKLGTYALAVCAASLGKPLYVAAESYKFARLYPLHQSDLPSNHTHTSPLLFVDTTTYKEEDTGSDLIHSHKNALKPLQMDANIQVVNPAVDFTPAKFITLLFTDLGVLTPSAVSDELIRLYQ